jgi:hypothetical protein
MTTLSPARAAISAAAVAARAQAIAQAYAAHHGRKRGLGILGRILGSDRRARGIYSGEARRIEAHEYLALLEAEQALRRERAARLRAELSALEREAECDSGLPLLTPSAGSATASTTPPTTACDARDA